MNKNKTDPNIIMSNFYSLASMFYFFFLLKEINPDKIHDAISLFEN